MAFARHLQYFLHALFLESVISHRDDLVKQQDFRLDMSGDGKGEAHIHACRIMLDGCFQKLLDLSESHDLIKFAPDLCATHAEEIAMKENILAPGEIRME